MNYIFDLDGTISDPFEGITKSINYALSKFHKEEKGQNELAKYIGPSLKVTFGELLETDNEESIMAAIAFYRERYFSIGFKENELYEGISELLNDTRELGHRQFIATSKRGDVASNVIDYFELSDCFDGVYGCDIHLSKSDLIKKILEDRGIYPEGAVMIGDRRFDIEAGKENGLMTIGVLWGYGSREELASAGANEIVSSIDELRRLLFS